VALFEQLSAMNTHGTKQTKLRPRAPDYDCHSDPRDDRRGFCHCVSLPELSYFSIWCRRASWNHLDRRAHEDAIFLIMSSSTKKALLAAFFAGNLVLAKPFFIDRTFLSIFHEFHVVVPFFINKFRSLVSQ
jgi:hypothetical protein